MLGAASVDLGPFLALEQAMLAEASRPERRNRAFGRYSLSGGLAAAAGAVTAGWAVSPHLLQALFVGYGLIGVTTAALAAVLSAAVEGSTTLRAPGRAAYLRPLAALSALFAIDAVGGGLVVQPFIAYWLHIRFGAGLQVLGPALGAMALVQAGSFEAASRLADRFGLVSVGAGVAIAGSVAAKLITQQQAGLAAALAVTLGLCLMLGAWNGLLVAAIGVQPIVATLILMVAGRGIAQLLTDGQIIAVENPEFSFFAGGHFLGLPFPVTIVAAMLLMTVALTRVMTSMLFEVSPLDPMTYGTVSMTLLLVAVVASALPALRATSVDPVEVLRAE